MSLNRLLHFLGLGLCLFISSSLTNDTNAYGQALYGSVTGNVADASGARVPGAEAKIVNPDTNYSQSSVTNESGIFRLENVPDGIYNLTVSLAGFKESAIYSIFCLMGVLSEMPFSRLFW